MKLRGHFFRSLAFSLPQTPSTCTQKGRGGIKCYSHAYMHALLTANSCQAPAQQWQLGRARDTSGSERPVAQRRRPP